MGGKEMKIGAYFMLLVLVPVSVFADTVAVFPCRSKPSSDGTCPALTGLPAGTTVAIGKDDYYDVYVESTCIDQSDSWWKKKLVSFNVTITIGADKPVVVPVYSERAEGAGCRIGVNNFPVMTSIPSNGQPLTLQVSVLRSNASDGLKQLLSFATTTSQDPSLNTYAAAAIPYMGLADNIANTAYKAFGQDTTPWLQTTATALHPAAALPDRFELRDGYLLQYSGNDSPRDGDLYVDSGDVRWTNGTLLRGGATWVLFRIEKYSRRTDFPTRSWYQSWESLLQQTEGGSVGADAFKSRYQQVITLLQNDPDFTAGDKNQYVQSFTTVRDAILTELGKPSPDYAAIARAINGSEVPTQQIHLVASGTSVTAINSKVPVVYTQALALKRVIVPGLLADRLKAELK
jgi:hypothetical protein